MPEKESEVRYKTKSDLPETLRISLPEEAQDLYLRVYKESWENYEEPQGGEASREAVAHRNAMAVVERKYVHHKESGKWYPKGEGPEEEEEEGIIEKIKEAL
jgi:cation transport regulator